MRRTLREQLEPEDQSLVDSIDYDKAIALSSYSVAGSLTQTNIGFQNMLNKKYTWWEKMMFAILFLISKSQYKAISNMLQGNQPEEILKFYTFGQDAYNFYKSTWEERTKEDIQKLQLRPDLLINKRWTKTCFKQIFRYNIRKHTYKIKQHG